jgi:hypothetical protein
MNLSGKTLTFATNQISGNAIDGGVISNFTSTGIDDNSSATAVTILSDGKVGIGVTNPRSFLDVKINTNRSLNVRQSTDTPAGTGLASIDPVSGNVRDMSIEGEEVHLSTGASSGSTTSPRLSILNNGNVGIGTTTPTVKLTTAIPHSNGAVAEGLKLTTDGSYSSGNSEEAGPAISFGQFHTLYPTWKTGQISGIRDGASWNGSLSFWTNTGSSETDISEKMRITGAGNVGIGETSPGAKLDIKGGNGNQLYLDNAGERFTQISFQNNGSQEAALWYDATDNYLVAHANAGDGFKVQTGGSSDRLIIDSSGVVTMPAQPAMFAQPDSSSPVAVGNGATKFGWNTSGGVRFNRGFTISGAAGGSARFNAANTGRITVPSAGIYKLYFTIRCEGAGTSGQAGVFVNGTQYIRRHVEEWATINYNHFEISATLNLSASDYIELGAWWNSTPGGALSGTSDTVNWMSFEKIS